jgi:hypothetical protein
MANTIGSVIPIAASFAVAGTQVDPASLSLVINAPDGSQQTINTVAAGQLVHDSLGNYHYALTLAQAGTYAFVWTTTGPVFVVFGTVESISPNIAVPRVMTSYELELTIGAATVDQLFDDNNDSQRDMAFVSQMLRRAEDYALTFMLSGWADVATCVKVMQGDAILRMHIAWVACEFAGERRKEFLAADGKGPYYNQYTRAEKYFTQISVAELASVSESTAGVNAQSGGVVQPTLTPGTSRFVFAPDKNSPFGHGGFAVLIFILFELVQRAMMHAA